MNRDDDEFVLGLRKGESVPMERHGQMGVLYRPTVQLTALELQFYSEVWAAWGDRDLGSRENTVKLVEDVAAKTIADETSRPSMVGRIMAYIDEIAETQEQKPRVISYSWHDPKFGLLVSHNKLLQRGWTEAKIKQHLGDPDLLGRNPRGGHVRLYSEKRVRRVKIKAVP